MGATEGGATNKDGPPTMQGHAGPGNQLGQGLSPVPCFGPLDESMQSYRAAPCPTEISRGGFCFPSLVKASSPHVPWEDAWRRQAWEEIGNKPPFRIPFLCPPLAIVLAFLLFLTFLPEDVCFQGGLQVLMP